MNAKNIRQLEQEARVSIDSLAANQLTAEQLAALEARLLNDPEFRAVYVEQVDLEAELENLLQESPVGTSPARPQVSIGWGISLAIALSLLVAVGLLNLFWLNAWRKDQPNGPMLDFAESQLLGQHPVAIVLQTSEDALGQSSLKVGDRVKPGALRLNRGQLRLEFLSGVRVQLEAPGEIHLLSDHEATLVNGRASVVTPPDTRSFSLNGPIATIASGSSEFVCQVNAKDVEIGVRRGDVMASLLGPSGDTLRSEPVAANQLARFDHVELTVVEHDFSDEDRVDVLPVDQQSLSPNAQYAAAVAEDEPLVYWRFEDGDMTGDQVRNHMSDDYLGVIHGPHDGSLRMQQGCLHFSESPQSRYFGGSQPLEDLNQGEFTIEFWVRAERMHWGTFLGLLPTDQADAKRQTHLCVLEYANQTNVVHRPATIRMLYRYPPDTYEGGINLFSAESCAPGMWTHVAAVKRTDGIYLYCNGKLQFILDLLQLDDPRDYEVVLGQLDAVRTRRQFHGEIDEVAIYKKALSPEKIRRHYELIAGPPQT